MRRQLASSIAPAALACSLLLTGCGGSNDPQLVQSAESEETPSSLSFAVETTEPATAAPTGDPGQPAEASGDAGQATLFACSDAIIAFLETNPYETAEDIEAIEVTLMSGDSPVSTSCEGLQNPEDLGLTEEDLMGHMLAEVPADALGALVQLSDVLMG